MSETKNLNLTKKDISKRINLITGLPISYTNKIINDFIDILKVLIREKELNIKNFATFKIVNKNERLGRNPKNKKIYKIKARKSLSINISKKLNDNIKDL
jgi:nucleoid DNA-binding protein